MCSELAQREILWTPHALLFQLTNHPVFLPSFNAQTPPDRTEVNLCGVKRLFRPSTDQDDLMTAKSRELDTQLIISNPLPSFSWGKPIVACLVACEFLHDVLYTVINKKNWSFLGQGQPAARFGFRWKKALYKLVDLLGKPIDQSMCVAMHFSVYQTLKFQYLSLGCCCRAETVFFFPRVSGIKKSRYAWQPNLILTCNCFRLQTACRHFLFGFDPPEFSHQMN